MQSNHNKDYSVVKTFKAGRIPRFFAFLLSHKNKQISFSKHISRFILQIFARKKYFMAQYDKSFLKLLGSVSFFSISGNRITIYLFFRLK